MQKKGKTNNYRIYSTKNQEDMQVLWALLCKKKNLSEKDVDYTCRLSQGNIQEVETTFGSSTFEMCNNFSKRLKASFCMEPPRTWMQNNPYLDKNKNKFVLSDDDSNAKFDCNLFNTPRTIITPSSLQNNNLSSGQKSDNNNIQNENLLFKSMFCMLRPSLVVGL